MNENVFVKDMLNDYVVYSNQFLKKVNQILNIQHDKYEVTQEQIALAKKSLDELEATSSSKSPSRTGVAFDMLAGNWLGALFELISPSIEKKALKKSRDVLDKADKS